MYMCWLLCCCRYAEAESRYGPKPNVRQAVAAYAQLAQQHGMSPTAMALR
jgi:N-acetyltransferase 10